MRFRKPWLRMKSVDFNFSVKSSSTDYNKWNKPTTKSLAHIRDLRNRLLNLEFQKMSFFTFSHFLLYWKIYFSPRAMGRVKSSSTDYNELNKPNPKPLAHIGCEKSLVQLGVPKNELFHFFHFTEKFTFSP